MPGTCLNPYGCEWDIGYLWRLMSWIGHADVYLLAILLAYSAAVFLRVFRRYCRTGRAPEIDSSGRMKVVADLRTATRSLQSIAFIAPYLGLAGTCFGILEAFRGFDMEFHAVRAMLTAIIASALLTTIAGILVALFATFFYNYLSTRDDLLQREFLNERVSTRLPLQKRFSEIPAFALLAAPSLAMALVAFMSLSSFRQPKGLNIEFASTHCEYEGDDGIVVLHITNGGSLFLNSEQQNWDTVAGRLAKAYGDRSHRVLYLLADDGVPFQTVADAVDMAENAKVGTSSLNILVRLITPKVMHAPCPVGIRHDSR